MSYHSNTPMILEEQSEYRKCISGFNMPAEDANALINIVRSILSYFVDYAFHVHTDQITLHSASRSACNPTVDCVELDLQPETQTADAQFDGAECDSNKQGPSEP